jgi:hypothetical protein
MVLAHGAVREQGKGSPVSGDSARRTGFGHIGRGIAEFSRGRRTRRVVRGVALAALLVPIAAGPGGQFGPTPATPSGLVHAAAVPSGIGPATAGPATAGPATADRDAPRALPPGSTFHVLTQPPALLGGAAAATLGATITLSSGKTASVQVAGALGVPVGATAVTGTISVSAATRSGYVALTPVAYSAAEVATRTIDFAAGEPAGSGTTATLGDDGRVWAIYVAGSAGQTAQMRLEVTGYFAPDKAGATYHAVKPVQVLDSQTGLGGAAPLCPSVAQSFRIAGVSGVPAGAIAATGTLTIASPARGRLTLTPEDPAGGGAAPATAIAVAAHRPTGVTVPLGPDGRLWARLDGDAVDGGAGDCAQLGFELTGYFTPDMSGSSFHRLGPVRLIDTTTGLGVQAGGSGLRIAGLYGIPKAAVAVAGTLYDTNGAMAIAAPLSARGDLLAPAGRPAAGGVVGFDLIGYFAPDAAGLLTLPPYFQTASSFEGVARDDSGVAMPRYTAPLGLQYNAVTVSQCALWYFNRWHSATESEAQAQVDRAGFFAQVEWLVANQEPDGRWLYKFKWGTLPLPWWSGMAEGQAMSALLRAYSVTGDRRYFIAVERAGTTFDRSLAELGVASEVTVSGRRLVVYQEYLPGYEDNVLNGWVFGLIGLYECAIYLGDPVCVHDLTAADRGLAAVRFLLPYYDTGSWSRYSVDDFGGPTGSEASKSYHGLHIRQLRYLYSLTADPVMKLYADKFQAYLDAGAG